MTNWRFKSVTMLQEHLSEWRSDHVTWVCGATRERSPQTGSFLCSRRGEALKSRFSCAQLLYVYQYTTLSLMAHILSLYIHALTQDYFHVSLSSDTCCATALPRGVYWRLRSSWNERIRTIMHFCTRMDQARC